MLQDFILRFGDEFLIRIRGPVPGIPYDKHMLLHKCGKEITYFSYDVVNWLKRELILRLVTV
jgi:hypothetical protein